MENENEKLDTLRAEIKENIETLIKKWKEKYRYIG